MPHASWMHCWTKSPRYRRRFPAATATPHANHRLKFAASAADVAVAFAGIPLGHEFTSLVLALLHVGGHPMKIDAALAAQVRALEGDYQFENLHVAALPELPGYRASAEYDERAEPRIRHIAIDGALFEAEVAAKHICRCPPLFYERCGI